MPDVAAPFPSVRTFATALFVGLLWGIGAATVIAGLVVSVEATGPSHDPTMAPTIVLEAMTWAAMIASFLALFPIGPIAGVIGWQLYRRGVVARWAYALAGALSTLAAPVLIVVVGNATARYSTMNEAVPHDSVTLLVIAAFPIIGAFGGFMAARALRRDGGADDGVRSDR